MRVKVINGRDTPDSSAQGRGHLSRNMGRGLWPDALDEEVQPALVAETTFSPAENLVAAVRLWGLFLRREFCQGPWNADSRTPPGPEGSNGSLLCMRRGYPGFALKCER